MSKKIRLFFITAFISFLAVLVVGGISDKVRGAGETTYPWPSWRHDLANTAAAPDSGYPTTAEVLWKVNRPDRPDEPGTPAAAGGPVVVDKGMVYTTGKGLVTAMDQFTGNLIWSRAFTSQKTAVEPADAPDDWCYHDIPTVDGNTGMCYVPNLADCPSWCLQCTTDKPDCSSFSLLIHYHSLKDTHNLFPVLP